MNPNKLNHHRPTQARVTPYLTITLLCLALSAAAGGAGAAGLDTEATETKLRDCAPGLPEPGELDAVLARCGVSRAEFETYVRASIRDKLQSMGSAVLELLKLERMVVEAPGHKRSVLGVYPRSDADGVYIGDVTPDGPADRAGVEAGDRVLAVNDNPLPGKSGEASRTLAQRILAAEAGDTVHLTVTRHGSEQTFAIQVGELSMPGIRLVIDRDHLGEADGSE